MQAAVGGGALKHCCSCSSQKEPELMLMMDLSNWGPCWYQPGTTRDPGTCEAGNSHCSLFPTSTELQFFCFGTI